MPSLHVHGLRHTFDIAEAIAAGGVAAAVTLVSVITAATLIYVWFFA
jgi:hypothetical protein